MAVVIEEKDFTWSHYLFDPAPNVNYNVILCLQLAGVFIGAVLAFLWLALGVAEGYCVIFFPFVPSAAWAYVVRGRWIRDDWDPDSERKRQRRAASKKQQQATDTTTAAAKKEQ